MQIWPPIEILLYIVPFIPPYIITKTSMKINQRIAAHDFIRGAIPYVFVAYPEDISLEGLLNTKPEMISNSAARHFNYPIEKLLNDSALPSAFFTDEKSRKSLIMEFIRGYKKHSGYAVIRDYKITIYPHGKNIGQEYLVNGLLKAHGKRVKWQATLMRYGTTDGAPFIQEEFPR